MAYSFISYQDRHLRVNDFDLIVLIFLLERAALNIKLYSDLEGIFSIWKDSVENDGAGNINLNLDNLILDCQYANLLLSTAQEAGKILNALPDTVSADYLRQLVRLDGVIFGEYRKKFLKEILNSFEGIANLMCKSVMRQGSKSGQACSSDFDIQIGSERQFQKSP